MNKPSYRHKCIVHIRDNYPDMFEVLSASDARYDLDDYSHYFFMLFPLHSRLGMGANYCQKDFYIDLYINVVTQKDILKDFETELLWDKL